MLKVSVSICCLFPPALAPVGTSGSGGLFLLRDQRVSGATPDPPAAEQELEEEELIGALPLCSVLPMEAWLVRAQATTSDLTASRGESLSPKVEL